MHTSLEVHTRARFMRRPRKNKACEAPKKRASYFEDSKTKRPCYSLLTASHSLSSSEGGSCTASRMFPLASKKN